jgi:hypothetical protein
VASERELKGRVTTKGGTLTCGYSGFLVNPLESCREWRGEHGCSMLIESLGMRRRMGLIPALRRSCLTLIFLSDGVKCARGCAFKGCVWMAVGGYRMANAPFRMSHWPTSRSISVHAQTDSLRNLRGALPGHHMGIGNVGYF